MISVLMTPTERALELARREKIKRKRMKITQKEMAERTGISLGSIKRFEQTGEISFVSLVKIADVLGEAVDFDNIFTTKVYNSIQEVIDENR